MHYKILSFKKCNVITIPKVGSTSFSGSSNMVSFKTFYKHQEKEVYVKNKNPNFIFVREPLSRWISGYIQWHSDIYGATNRREKKYRNINKNFLACDVHTILQSFFLPTTIDYFLIKFSKENLEQFTIWADIHPLDHLNMSNSTFRNYIKSSIYRDLENIETKEILKNYLKPDYVLYKKSYDSFNDVIPLIS